MKCMVHLFKEIALYSTVQFLYKIVLYFFFLFFFPKNIS